MGIVVILDNLSISLHISNSFNWAPMLSFFLILTMKWACGGGGLNDLELAKLNSRVNNPEI